jgi:chromosome segregation ATPase
MSLFDKMKGRSKDQEEESKDTEDLAANEITALKQKLSALTQNVGDLQKRVREFGDLLPPYMKQVRTEIDSVRGTMSSLTDAVESLRKSITSGGLVTASVEGSGEGSPQVESTIPKSAITGIMQAADVLVKTAHDLTNLTATYFPKMEKRYMELIEQQTLIHQKLSAIDGRLTTVEKILKITVPSPPEAVGHTAATPAIGADPEIAAIIDQAAKETDQELRAQRKLLVTKKVREKLETVGKGADA